MAKTKPTAKSAGIPLIGQGIAAIIKPEKMPTDRQMTKDHAKRAMRHATEDWVDGRITTAEHNAVHARGKHVMSGKAPHAFKGKSGERKPKGM